MYVILVVKYHRLQSYLFTYIHTNIHTHTYILFLKPIFQHPKVSDRAYRVNEPVNDRPQVNDRIVNY